jgi:hypothetical protein
MNREVTIGLLIGAVALAFAAFPILHRKSAPCASDEHALDCLVDRAADSLAAATACARCYAANPAGSRFCAACGKPLAGAHAPAAGDADAGARGGAAP